MKLIEEFVEELSEEQLKTAFGEIQEWRKAGVLVEGVIRQVHSEYENQEGVNKFPFYMMDTVFLYEIAKRHYE